LVFHSDLFDTHPTYQLLKSLLLDFYNGHALTEMPLAAVEHVISITAGPLVPSTSSDPDAAAPLPMVHFRTYSITLLPAPSSSRAPKLQMTEMGPSIDFTLRRVQEADEERMAQAMKRPKVAKKDIDSGLGKKKKNIETDEMGDTVGKIHLPRQDLNKMQGRKMKGLKVHKEGKKAAAPAEGEAGDVAMDE
jgi:ribosome production factor 2